MKAAESNQVLRKNNLNHILDLNHFQMHSTQ